MNTIDSMKLTEKDYEDLRKSESLWGKDWVDRRKRYLKGKLYIETYLDSKCLLVKSPFRCYTEGTNAYKRKDGQPLNSEDIQAIYESSPGQGSKVIGKAGDLEVKHEWYIDSSD